MPQKVLIYLKILVFREQTTNNRNIKDLQKITFHFLGEILAFGISVIFGV